MTKFREGVVAVIADDMYKTLPYSSALRRAGITTETYFSNNIKKQMKKSVDLEAVVIIMNDVVSIRDMLSGNQRVVKGDVVAAVNYVLSEGYYDD